MSVQEIMQQVEALTPEDQRKLTAFLVHLRQEKQPGFYKTMSERLNRTGKEEWRSLNDLEQG